MKNLNQSPHFSTQPTSTVNQAHDQTKGVQDMDTNEQTTQTPQVTTQSGNRLKPINSDPRREVVLDTIVSQMINGTDNISVQLKDLYGEQALQLQTKFQATRDALTNFFIRKDDLLQRRTKNFNLLKSQLRGFWTILKHRTENNENASRIFRAFGLMSDGSRPKSVSRENLCLYAKEMIRGGALAAEKNWVLPGDYPIADFQTLLTTIEEDEVLYFGLPREKREILNQLDLQRKELTIFFQKLRGSLRVLTVEDGPARTREQHRSFGFEYYGQPNTQPSNDDEAPVTQATDAVSS